MEERSKGKGRVETSQKGGEGTLEVKMQSRQRYRSSGRSKEEEGQGGSAWVLLPSIPIL